MCGEDISTAPTLMLSGRPSSRCFSFSLLVMMLTVSSTFGLVLLLLSCCSSVPVSAATFWSVWLLHVSVAGLKPPCPLSPPPCDCFSLSSEAGTAEQNKCGDMKTDHVNLICEMWFSGKPQSAFSMFTTAKLLSSSCWCKFPWQWIVYMLALLQPLSEGK